MGQREGGVGKASGSAVSLRFAEGEGGPTVPGVRPPFLGPLEDRGRPDAGVMTPLLLCHQQVICVLTLRMCGDPIPQYPFCLQVLAPSDHLA